MYISTTRVCYKTKVFFIYMLWNLGTFNMYKRKYCYKIRKLETTGFQHYLYSSFNLFFGLVTIATSAIFFTIFFYVYCMNIGRDVEIK